MKLVVHRECGRVIVTGRRQNKKEDRHQGGKEREKKNWDKDDGKSVI